MSYQPTFVITGLEFRQNGKFEMDRKFDLFVKIYGNFKWVTYQSVDLDGVYYALPDLPLKKFQEGKKLGLLTMMNVRTI